MTKILLIEDNEMSRDMLSRRLQKKGYEIITAVDGEEGLAKAQTEKPALILMDMTLPGIDGWDATRRLKAAPETQTIPIIALTAHAMAGDREKALAEGCEISTPSPSSWKDFYPRYKRCSERMRIQMANSLTSQSPTQNHLSRRIDRTVILPGTVAPLLD